MEITVVSDGKIITVRLKELRIEVDLTQKQAAELVQKLLAEMFEDML